MNKETLQADIDRELCEIIVLEHSDSIEADTEIAFKKGRISILEEWIKELIDDE